MARVGLCNFLRAEYDEKTGTYAEPEKFGGAIEFKEALDRNDAKLYADNALDDSDTSVTGGKITLTVSDDDEVIFAPVLGESNEEITIGEKSFKKIVSKTDDAPIPQGFGYITQKNTKKYVAIFYPKVTFVRGDDEAKTKEEKVEYVKPTIEGTIYPVEGEYKIKIPAETLEDAVKALYYLFGKNKVGANNVAR